MGLMGIAILAKEVDVLLFECAYKLFAGDKEAPDISTLSREALMIIRATHRMVPLTGAIPVEDQARKIYAVAAYGLFP